MISQVIGKILGEYKIDFISYKDNRIKINLTCQKCGNKVEKFIKDNRVGRLDCDNCDNKKILVFNNLENYIIGLKIISVYQYNKLVKLYKNNDDTEINKNDFIKKELFNNIMIKEKSYSNDSEIKKDNLKMSIKSKRYIGDNNGITFRKIDNTIENKDNKKENNIDPSKNNDNQSILDRLMEKETNNFYTWCKLNGELGELVIKLYSKRKNNIKLNELTVDDKNDYWFNRGGLKGYFTNSPFEIVKTKKIRKKLPNRYSYNKLFIYNFFKLIYNTELNKEISEEIIDVYINEIKLAIIYIGTTYKYNKDIEKIKSKLKNKDVRLIIIEGTHVENNINLINNVITFNGNNKNNNINELLYTICKLVLKEYDQRSYIVPSMENIVDKMKLIY